MDVDALKTQRFYDHFSGGRKFPAEPFPCLLCNLPGSIFCEPGEMLGLEHDFRLIRTFKQILGDMESRLKTLQDLSKRRMSPMIL